METSGPDFDHRVESIVVYVDAFDAENITGWAYTEGNLDVPVRLHLYIDGIEAVAVECTNPRHDVAVAGKVPVNVGFSAAIPPRFCDGGVHALELRSDNIVRFITSSGVSSSCTADVVVKRYEIDGQIDGFRSGAIQGWVIVTDRQENIVRGRQQLLVSIGGNAVAQIEADSFRADVAQSLSCTPRCGFSYVPPLDVMAGTTVEFSFQVLPDGGHLRNSPFRIAFPEMEVYDSIREVQKSIDTIFSQLWMVRSKMHGLVQPARYGLFEYDAWAREYFRKLSGLQGKIPHKQKPLVSVICPTYKPRLQDFKSAVESVINQTYENWELLIIDDASRDEDLSSLIRSFGERDSRIRFIFNDNNSGISASTNAGLKAAKGKYIALFDHDDLLVDLALDLMVYAAEQSGARMLYSDEDKIDDDGRYSEVNFKPDWNYRLLLSQNYICHLLIFERRLLNKAGLLNSRCDGAQDHDLIIRLSEHLSASEILHVPEVLYHWRKTPFSTASSGKAKTYTVEAGIRALTDHLNRKSLDVVVSSPHGITCYKIDVRLKAEPRVAIIIPYREQISLTRLCVESIRKITRYQNYEIVLVDNWSISKESHSFMELMVEAGVTVVRIEEPFNYSRLNNIAVSYTDAECVLFMNNDVIVEREDWLDVLVGELAIDDKVGIVGSKLLYPNGLVQHAGVVLGVGGVADHSFRGLELSDPSYCARAISAQYLSAVTAACMLCRRSVFDLVGGFDEQDLQVAFNDVDLCLKVAKAGYQVAWTPFSVSVHHESISRGSDFKPERQPRFFHEIEVMMDRWKSAIEADPHYNPHFSRRSGIFQDLSVPSVTSSTMALLSR